MPHVVVIKEAKKLSNLVFDPDSSHLSHNLAAPIYGKTKGRWQHVTSLSIGHLFNVFLLSVGVSPKIYVPLYCGEPS